MSDLVGTVEQVAERLECDANFVRDLIRNNAIPYVRLGPRKVVVPWRALDDFLAERAALSVKSSDPPALGLVGDTTG